MKRLMIVLMTLVTVGALAVEPPENGYYKTGELLEGVEYEDFLIAVHDKSAILAVDDNRDGVWEIIAKARVRRSDEAVSFDAGGWLFLIAKHPGSRIPYMLTFVPPSGEYITYEAVVMSQDDVVFE